jgi:hypothetical protein
MMTITDLNPQLIHFMLATVLTQLTAAKVTQQDYADAGVRQTIHHSPQRGINRQVSLGPSGVTIARGNAVVAIPIDELLRIADAAEPRLAAAPVKPPKPSKAPPAAKTQ